MSGAQASPDSTAGGAAASKKAWLDVDSRRAATSICQGASEYFCYLANDPTVAHTRIGQNVHRAVPIMVTKTEQIKTRNREITGMKEDLVHTIRSLDNVCDAPTFKSVHSKLVCATEFARQMLQDAERSHPMPQLSPSPR
ncbi:hypothetical protein DIPPA_30906 [Diplonema papillatum]|nr:hypothetical protein DIPPA_30906 [Diplonema papillatum]